MVLTSHQLLHPLQHRGRHAPHPPDVMEIATHDGTTHTIRTVSAVITNPVDDGEELVMGEHGGSLRHKFASVTTPQMLRTRHHAAALRPPAIHAGASRPKPPLQRCAPPATTLGASRQRARHHATTLCYPCYPIRKKHLYSYN